MVVLALSDRINVSGNSLEIIDCGECGVVFAMPERVLRLRRKTGGAFYCPNGHRLAFTETEVDRLKNQLSSEKKQATYWHDEYERAKDATEREERRANGYKGQLALQKKRVAAGVCPCCNRTFQNLQRHMKCKHPEFGE